MVSSRVEPTNYSPREIGTCQSRTPPPPNGPTDLRHGGDDSGPDFDGGNGDDTISGSRRQRQLTGGNGRDFLDGGGGNDQLFGGNGKDVSTAALGNDQLFGSNGKDILDGGENDDKLFGGNGKDDLDGGAGSDQLFGGRGKDPFRRRRRRPAGGGKGRYVLDVVRKRTLEGGAAKDTFKFGVDFGTDTIVDLWKGHELIDLRDAGVTIDDPPFSIGDDPATGNVIIVTSQGTIVVSDVAGNLAAADFTELDFLFAT